MTTITNQIKQVLPERLSHGVYFKEQSFYQKGFFGTKKVTRLHLATKNNAGKEVILDQKGVKATKGFFGTTFRVQASSGRYLDYKVNTRSLKNLLARLEGEKVSYLKEKAPSHLGQRILSATQGVLKQTTREKLQDIVRAHAQEKAPIDAEVAQERESIYAKALELEEEIEDLQDQVKELEADIIELSGSTFATRIRLDKVKAELKEKTAELNRLNSPTPSSNASYASLDIFEDQLKAYGLEQKPERVNAQLLDQTVSNVTANWAVEKLNFQIRPTTPEQRRIDAELAQKEKIVNWWVKHVEKKLKELKDDPERNKDEIAHYESVLTKRVEI